MPVTFILGRAGTGKTRFCLDALSSELEKPDQSRKLILLVPEQASFQMERALALRAPRHGYWRAEVLSFTRLAFRVLGESGVAADVLNTQARTMALRRVAAATGDSLRVFGSATGTNGLFAQLDGLIEELLLEDVAPEALAVAAEQLEQGVLRRKVGAVARLYAAYLAWLGPERIDPCQRLAVLRERVEGTPWLRDASIWVDGFAGFTGQELATLVTLARQARDMVLTLLVDPQSPVVNRPAHTPGPLDLFQRTEQTYQRLVTLFEEARVDVRPPIRLQPECAPRFARSRPLARLEAGLALPFGVEPSPAPRDSPGQSADVRLLACTTHREELRQAASFIRRHIIESNGELHFRDFALIARDLEPFAELIAEVFDEYGIPYFLDRRRPMAAHVLTRFVQALFAALVQDSPVSATMRLLSSGLLPLSREHAERLQNTVVNNQVRGTAAWGQPSWDFERRGQTARPSQSTSELDAARLQVFKTLEPLVELANEPQPSAGAEWAKRLYATVEALGVARRIESWIAAARHEQAWETAELHRLAWEGLCGVLEDLHDVLGQTPLRVTEVGAIVGSALSEMTLGLAPPTLDQVLVGAIERTRHPEIQYAWVFAFNEGIFPAPPPEDHLLSTAEREALAAAGLHAAGSHRDDVFAERLLSYIALTRPAQGLTVSYAAVGDNGEPRFLSPLLPEVQRALPELHAELAEECPPPTCLAELARGYLTVRGRETPRAREQTRYEKLRTELGASSRHRQELDRLLRGTEYRNECPPVGNYRGDRAGQTNVVWSCSPSEIETYLQCPFKHLSKYGLRLDAQRGPNRLELDLGSAAHEILAALMRRAIDADASVRDLSDEQWLAFLRDSFGEFQRAQPGDLAHRQPQRAFLTGVLGGLLRDVVLAHAERWRRGRFEPWACEQRFDPAGGEAVLPALELKLADAGLIRVRGRIDRVDRCRHDDQTDLLAYDYKSSAATLGGEYLTQDRLQLFTYLLALGQAMGNQPGLHLAGVFLAPLYPDLAVLSNKYAAEAEEPDQRLYMYRPRGVFDTAAARLLDERLGKQASPVAHMRLKKDGGFDSRSEAKPPEEIAQRLELARRTILHAAQGVAAGHIDIVPLLERDRLACNFCDFRPVCRFERAFNVPRVAERTLPVLNEVSVSGQGGQQ
ncbi:MAG TPA: PD-(D/E)XK nuclease family protein [Phycisphaerae bacterium]|nr:PD-(D/E)XK nuclease family protein [Phycisphaerae bacterium]